MPENKGDNLEQFFRKGFSSYDIAYKENDWRQLEKRLYEVDRAFMAGFRRGAILFGSLLLILTGFLASYYIYTSSVQATEEAPSTEQKYGPEQPTERPDSERLSDQTGEALPQDRREGLSIDDRQDETQPIEALSDAAQEEEQVSDRQAFIADEDLNEGYERTSDKADTAPYRESSESIELIPVGIFPSYLDPELVLNFVLPAREDSIRIDKDHRFSWIVMISPESSMVGVNGFFKPSPAVSGLVEFKLFDNLWLNTGINYSHKLYSAHQREYQPPKGFWTRGVVPETTEGMCKMIDVPVNLNYNFQLSDYSKIYISAGTSSYLLLFQDYEYIYTSSDPDLIRDWIGRRNFIYPFRFINAGVGYSGGISEKLDFVVGPYVKIPTRGIGHGKIEMTTVGINLGLRVKKMRINPVTY